MFRGLHIEMAAFKTLGDWMAGSGWPEALSRAKVASSGTADSFLKASHVTRTRHAHQVKSAALYQLLHIGYHKYKCLQSQMEEIIWISSHGVIGKVIKAPNSSFGT
jgi:hypothetical protein